jgi:hypothetical protein
MKTGAVVSSWLLVVSGNRGPDGREVVLVVGFAGILGEFVRGGDGAEWRGGL